MVRGSRTGSKEGDNDYTSWSVRAVANSTNCKFPQKKRWIRILEMFSDGVNL